MTILRRLTADTAAGMAEAAVTPLRRFVLRQFVSTATSASAAQPQFDYDYYCYDNQAEHESRLRQLAVAPMEDSEGSVPTRELQLVFIGSPSTKKHVYAEKLSKLLAVPHISLASLVRQELSPRSSIYRQIANAVNCGKIVPEDIIIGLLSKRLKDGYHKGESGFILDGIPRSLYQATKPLEDYYRKQNKLINIEVGSAPGETWRALLVALHLQDMIVAPTSEKIT